MDLYHQLIDSFVRTRAGGWVILNIFSPIDKRLMRWSKGKLNTAVGTEFGPKCFLLRCTGAESGVLREIPLMATPFGERFVLIASATGQKKNPAWYHNLKKNPACSLVIPNRGEVACFAHEAEAEEREQAWRAADTQYSGYTDYQGRTARRIPVMVLTPTTLRRPG